MMAKLYCHMRGDINHFVFIARHRFLHPEVVSSELHTVLKLEVAQ